MNFPISSGFNPSATLQAKLDEIQGREDKDLAANDKLYEGYYEKAQDGDCEDIPSEALKNMAKDPKCSDDAREKINDELKSRGEQPQLSEAENDELYEGYYEDAKDGDCEDIPTEALKNMANDPKCSDEARENINKELTSRKEEPIVATQEEADELYEGWYEQAKDDDCEDLPTSVLQNMANDPKCSDDARENINKELEKRGEEPYLPAKEADELYQEYYDKACDGDTDKIPTSALKNMANDPKCSDDAREKINEELESRGEVPISM